MIILDATTKSLEILLGGAVTTTQLPFVATYVDMTTSAYTPGSNDGASNNTTAVTAVSAPASSTQRQVKLLTVYNADTASATLTVRYNNNSTTRIMWKGTLAVGDTFVYTDGEGARVIDTSGKLKVTSGTSVDTVTTKGDLLTYDTATTRLAVGTDGYRLQADSAESKGIKWASTDIGGRFTHNANQSISHNTSTVIALNTETYKTSGITHSTVTNNSRVTMDSAGKYIFTANVSWAANATGFRALVFKINGTTFVGIARMMAISTASEQSYQMAVTEWNANANDYVEIEVFQNSGSSINIETGSSFSPVLTVRKVDRGG